MYFRIGTVLSLLMAANSAVAWDCVAGDGSYLRKQYLQPNTLKSIFWQLVYNDSGESADYKIKSGDSKVYCYDTYDDTHANVQVTCQQEECSMNYDLPCAGDLSDLLGDCPSGGTGVSQGFALT